MSEEPNMPIENFKEQIPNDKEEVNENISQEQAIEEPETQDSQLQSENMEVHKHPHHVTHKKKWNEYLLEFFMLFLAVFLGFIAENMRENFADRERENQYMQSMVVDLKQDIRSMDSAIARNQMSARYTDTLLNLLEESSITEPQDLEFLYAAHYNYASFAYPADFTQRTLSQLKNSGGLRLIQNKEVSDDISIYDSYLLGIGSVYKSYDEATSNVFNAGTTIFDNRFLRNKNDITPTLLTQDRKQLRAYANYVFQAQQICLIYIGTLQDQKQLAEKLISLIQNSYHL